MTEMQQKFSDFILSKVKEENVEEVKALLNEAFEKQREGSFNLMYLTSFVPKLMGYVKEEAKDEVMKIVDEFKSKF